MQGGEGEDPKGLSFPTCVSIVGLLSSKKMMKADCKKDSETKRTVKERNRLCYLASNA